MCEKLLLVATGSSALNISYQMSSNMGGWRRPEVGKKVVVKYKRGKCMDGYRPFRSQTWLKLTC